MCQSPKRLNQFYIIYADESVSKGQFFSNFYGGALVRSKDFMPVNETLEAKKRELNLFKELKWQRVTEQYLEKYTAFVDTFFEFISQDKIKIRIMFTQNIHVPANLDAYQREHQYQLLYYQFIKHAFGFQYCNPSLEEIKLRIYLDEMGDNKEKNQIFKDYLISLNQTNIFKEHNIHVKSDQIAEINSEKHAILQGLDITMGAIQFRLNDLHKAKDSITGKRGKRTIAKEKLYKHLYTKICEIHPRFNIGKTTSDKGDKNNRWYYPYRHWLFIPQDFNLDVGKSKSKK